MPGRVDVVATTGKLLPDRAMRLWNARRKMFENRDWTAVDRAFAALRGALDQVAGAFQPTNQHVLPEHTPVSDQGERGTCAANAWMDALEILMGVESPGRVVQLSRLFAYWTARALTGLQAEDGGVYLRAVAHQLRAVGVVEERYMPYRDSLDAVLAPPSLSLYTMASNNRIGSFYRIVSAGPAKLDEIELAVRANHPVISSAPVGPEFVAYRGGGQVFGPPAQSEGLHAMIIVGVRRVGQRRQFLRRNSWGKAWGDDGHAWCDQDYVLLDDDVWVGTRLPGLI
jgi:hypothetical protein